MRPPIRQWATRQRHRWPALALWLALLALPSCEDSSPSTHATLDTSSVTAETLELVDGSYSCEATNITRGNGPYTLDCEKSDDTITLHFLNGGHIDLDIDSQESSGDGSWEITATHSRNGDQWELSIDE